MTAFFLSSSPATAPTAIRYDHVSPEEGESTVGKRLIRYVSSAVLIIAATVASADEYSAARAELIAAYQGQDFPAMVEAGERAVAARPNHPGALFNLALAHTLNDDPTATFDVLDRLLAIGVDFGIGEIDEFATIRNHDRWPSYEKRVAALRVPFGDADVVGTIEDQAFIPEGIAVDEDGTLFLGSIRKGQLVRIADGVEILSDRDGHWSVFGMRFDHLGNLWFASAAVPQLQAVGSDEGLSGLFRWNPGTGAVDTAAILPGDGETRVLGDLVIAGDAIYATDSIGGALYRYDIDDGEFHTVVAPGLWTSPQGLVLDETGEYLYVADYRAGLFRVTLADGSVAKVSAEEGGTDYGIDGLYRHGDELIAIRNGFRPHCVVAYLLREDGLAITRARVLASNLPEFDEPTLGAIVGEELWFVANSHWNRFDQENQLPDGLSGPIILKLRLGSQE